MEHLEGKCSLTEALEKIKLSSRRYAKRQLTWFRHEVGAITLFVDDEDGKMRDGGDILAEALAYYEEFKKQFDILKGEPQ